MRPAPCTTAAIDAAGAAAREAGGVGEVLNRIEPPARGSGSGSDAKKSMSSRSDRTTRSATARGVDPMGPSLPPAGRPPTGLKVATHGSHPPSCRSTTPTRLDGATASSHVRMGQVGSDRSRSSAS